MNNNTIEISGELITPFEFKFSKYNVNFYTSKISCLRNSGTSDIIEIMVSDEYIDFEDLYGKYVFVTGSIRTHNISDENGKVHLQLVVYVDDIRELNIRLTEDRIDVNNVYLNGFTCKNVEPRTTPRGKTLADTIIAVNRPYSHNDYIPCIFWNRDSDIISSCDIGTNIGLRGRLQSRSYNKKTDNGLISKTTYEVSIQEIEL